MKKVSYTDEFKAEAIKQITEVSRGMAWVYDKYVKDVSLYDVQRNAKELKRGLWDDSKQIPPWEWRRANVRN